MMMIQVTMVEQQVRRCRRAAYEHGGALSRAAAAAITGAKRSRARRRRGSRRSRSPASVHSATGSSRRRAAARGRRAGRICGCSRCGSTRPRRSGSCWPEIANSTSRVGDQVHFDPRQDVVPARLVAEGVERDVAVELAVDALEQVEVELGGHALRVVIGGDQALDRLHPVHADQQLRAGAEQAAELAQQVGRAPRHEIADGRAGEEAELGQVGDSGRQG